MSNAHNANGGSRPMNVTVVICTFNRAAMLRQALESLNLSTVPASLSWDVLVVDNNSTDNTKEVVCDFARRHPGRFRYVFEPRQGKSHALNTAISQAGGDVLAFTDDDATVNPAWLWNLTSSLLDGEWAGTGGRILPKWSSRPPEWLPYTGDGSFGPLALFAPNLPQGPLQEPPFGANMAFQRQVFKKYGGFRTDLGRCGNVMLSNEDTEFGRRLLAAGERLRYEPDALVYHSVPAQRIQKRYLLAWWFDKARGDIREWGVPSCTRWLVAGVPLYLFRRLAVWGVRWMITPTPRGRFVCKLNVWGKLGEIQECYRLSKAPGRPRAHFPFSL